MKLSRRTWVTIIALGLLAAAVLLPVQRPSLQPVVDPPPHAKPEHSSSFVIADPGWSYRAVGGRPVMDDGLRWLMPAADGALVRAHASMFAGMLFVELEVRNDDPTPVPVTLRTLRVRYEMKRENRPVVVAIDLAMDE